MKTYIYENDRRAINLSELLVELLTCGIDSLLSVYEENESLPRMCCIGFCCFRGKRIQADDFALAEQGIVVKRGEVWLLNGTELRPDFAPAPMVEVFYQRDEGSGTIDIEDCIIDKPTVKRWGSNPRFFRHKRGVFILCGQETIDGQQWIAFDLLVLNH